MHATLRRSDCERTRAASFALVCGALLAGGCASSSRHASGLEPLAEGERGYALAGARVLTLDAQDRIHEPGLVLVRGERIAYAGPLAPIPAGYAVRELRGAWIVPGMVDLHSHVQSGGFEGVNDMVYPINAELRASASFQPGNPEIDLACAAGITTLFGIPGSGSSIGGFGVLYKTKPAATYEQAVIADPGGMKVAQTHNPQRRGGDFGATWAGLSWILEEVNDRARAASRSGAEPDFALQNLARVHAGELPVLIHCAGSDGVANAVRMWKHRYDTRCVVSHACFDAYRIARYIVESGVPINHGPRTTDYVSTRDNTFVPTAATYLDAGAQQFSLNTDAPVIPQDSLALQATMSAHLGADSYQMLRALTVHPAQSIGLGDRLGSLEAGKSADLAVFDRNPIDARARALLVLIDGEIHHDLARAAHAAL
jgi:imidazolonepropionase-like amidohydrolase